MQTLILIAHSTPPLLVPQAMRSTVYVLSFIVSFSLSYSFTLTLSFYPFRPSTTPASHGGFLSPHHIHFSFLLDLTITRTIRRHFHPPACALISPCHPFALRVIHSRKWPEGPHHLVQCLLQ
ncbi:hypothetical protein F5888DRAFT_63835 [Russula emetica]|nr:hypothetical protein F5888DRAFT_63835 [Russula emetica]